MELILMTIGTSIDKFFYGFDMSIFEFFGKMQNTFLTYVANFFTSLGDEKFIILIMLLGILLCFFKKSRKYGVAIVFAIVIGTLITNIIIKPTVLRIRPYNTLQADPNYWAWYIGAGALSESDFSFPSGHTTGAFEVATAMMLVFWSKNKKKIACIFPALALCVMGSRVYLMVHYPSDVLAGLIVGVFSGTVAFFLMKLAIYLIENVKIFNWIDKIDLGKIKLFKWTNGKGGVVAVWILVFCAMLASYVPALIENGEEKVRCAYSEDYDCYNEAKVDDEDYPAIDGKNYCKIHWKELNGLSIDE